MPWKCLSTGCHGNVYVMCHKHPSWHHSWSWRHHLWDVHCHYWYHPSIPTSFLCVGWFSILHGNAYVMCHKHPSWHHLWSWRHQSWDVPCHYWYHPSISNIFPPRGLVYHNISILHYFSCLSHLGNSPYWQSYIFCCFLRGIQIHMLQILATSSW